MNQLSTCSVTVVDHFHNAVFIFWMDWREFRERNWKDGRRENFSACDGKMDTSNSGRMGRSARSGGHKRLVHTNFTGLDELSHFNVV